LTQGVLILHIENRGDLERDLRGLARSEPVPGTPTEAVDHPSHYHAGSGIEVITAIEAWGLGFARGNAVKYIARAGKKPGADPVEDLEKAAWYLRHEIERLKAERDHAL
jgi:hypothetical protein